MIYCNSAGDSKLFFIYVLFLSVKEEAEAEKLCYGEWW